MYKYKYIYLYLFIFFNFILYFILSCPKTLDATLGLTVAEYSFMNDEKIKKFKKTTA